MIVIENLYKSFGEKEVLSGVSLAIPPGRITAIIGKSGCGKSVLLKHIVGLLQPDLGRIDIDGLDVSAMDDVERFNLRKRIGYVFQGAALFDSLTVYENVVISLVEHGIRDQNILSTEAERVLIAVGLLPARSTVSAAEFEMEFTRIADKKPADLSGGMRKRVGVARALVGKPNYIFYDEPTTGLDPITSKQIDDVILDLARTLGVTSIVITHDMFSVFHIADYVIMLDNGQVAFGGTVSELKNTHLEAVREFISRYMSQ